MKVGTGLGGEEGLGRAEAERDVDLGAFIGERAADLEAVPGEGDLDGDVLGDLGEVPAFGQHLVMADGCHLGADGALDQVADLGHDLQEVAAALGDEGGVGGHTVDQTALRQVPDLGHVRRIDEELHARALLASYGQTALKRTCAN